MTKSKRIKLPAPHYFTKQEDAELIGYFHLARTALAGGDSGRWARLNYAAKWFNKKHPSVSTTRAYKRIDDISRVLR